MDSLASSVITLTTDFGSSGAYASLIKGAILSINPRAILIDVTHEIALGDIFSASYILGTLNGYFPKGTIHVAVVDPGVGSSRTALVIDMGSQFFVGPDNGLVSNLHHAAGKVSSTQKQENRMSDAGTRTPALWKIYKLNRPEYWNHPVSPTFHGRDIFAPVAAHISLGVHPSNMGSLTSDLIVLKSSVPRKNGSIVSGNVIHIDRFGNIVSNVTEHWVEGDRSTAKIHVGELTVVGIDQYYSEKHNDFIVLVNSAGYLELAYSGKSAADILNARIGQPFNLELVDRNSEVDSN
jgi:S-adenosylmethionine hydrolase